MFTAGPKSTGHILRAALPSPSAPHPFQQRIEAGRRRACRREAHRLDAVVDAQMVRLLVLLSRSPCGPSDTITPDAQPFHALQMLNPRPNTARPFPPASSVPQARLYCVPKKHILSFSVRCSSDAPLAVFSITRQAGRQERPSVFEAFIAVFRHSAFRRSLTSSSPGTSPPCLR